MTMFEQAVKAAIEASGVTYSQLAKEANVDPSQVGKFMAGKRGLTTETVGRILDALGCTLTAPINRYAPKPVGRPRKYVSRGKVWDDEGVREGNIYVTKDGEVLEIKEDEAAEESPKAIEKPE
jgi:transcriptional regulator with XRE-family HTH domain